MAWTDGRRGGAADRGHPVVRAILVCVGLDPDPPARAPPREDEPALDLFSDDPFPDES